MERSTERVVILTLRRAIEEYIEDTNFGATSLWSHGEVGRTRADNLIHILNNNKVWTESHQIWSILYCLYKSNSTGLKAIVTQRLIYCSSLGEKIYRLMKEHTKRMDYVAAQEICLFKIIQDQMLQMPDDRTDTLINYLNGDTQGINIDLLIETIHLPKIPMD